MEERFSEEGVRLRMVALRQFHRHALAYVLAASATFVLDLLAGTGEGWPLWPLTVWGAVLALHAAQVFGRRRRRGVDEPA